MVAQGATEREFTAPAASLTLLRVGGWSRRLDMLDLLERSRHEGLDLLLDAWDGAAPAEAAGADLVVATLRRWLRARPEGPLELGPASVGTVGALACGWSTALIHALAAGPRSLAELEAEVTCVYVEGRLREHLEALVRSGQAEPQPGAGDEDDTYALTPWGRDAIAPLIAAARHEIRFPERDILPPEVLDVECTFQICVPPLRLPTDLRGPCHLSVQVPGKEPVRAGATVEVADGRVASSTILLEQDPPTWVTGGPLDWCEAVVDPAEAGRLETGGDTALAGALLTALHEYLFGGGA